MPKWAIITYLHIIVEISRLLLGAYQCWVGRLLETGTQAMSGYQSGSSDLYPWFSKNRRTGSAIYNHSSQKLMNKSKCLPIKLPVLHWFLIHENCWFLKVFEMTRTSGSLVLNFLVKELEPAVLCNCK
jgi:hypothetical protein